MKLFFEKKKKMKLHQLDYVCQMEIQLAFPENSIQFPISENIITDHGKSNYRY